MAINILTDATAGRGNWRFYYGIEDLACTLLCITQDSNGYLWIGTNGRGVLRHDGQVWASYSIEDGLADAIVNDILQDRTGNLWFATGWHGGVGKGVSRYDGRNWRTFTTADGLANDTVTAMLEDDEGGLWFATAGGGISRFKDDSWTTYTTKDGLGSNYVTTMLQDRDGAFWFGTGWFFMHEAGVTRLDHGSWSDLVPAHGQGHAWRFLQDREGNVWIAYNDHGIARYDGNNWVQFTTADGVSDDEVYDLMEDETGTIWAATRSGVCHYRADQWESVNAVEGLSTERINALYQSRDGHVWAATTSGLCRYDGSSFRTLDTEHGLVDDRITYLLPESKGGLWIGTVDSGVSYYKDGTIRSFTTSDGLADNRIWSIIEDRQGRIWFATLGAGVSCYDGSWRTYGTADGLANDSIISICEDQQGVMWFGSDGAGVSCFDGTDWCTFTETDGLASNRVKWITEDQQGALWFGTAEGVSRKEGDDWVTYDENNGLAANFVQSILVDRRGDVWVGTGMGGVSRYDGHRWTTYSQADGLSSNWITWIFEDTGGHLWFGTMNGGVSRYDGETFLTINRQDGLADNTVWAVTEDREGIYWFATFHGVTRYRPPEPEPPPVFIDVVISDRRHDTANTALIRSSVNHAIFEFCGMSFNTRPDGLLYRYRLAGRDNGWRRTRLRRVIYANLPVGEYTFEVEAFDRDLVRSQNPASIRLSVERDVRDEQIGELEQRVQERTQMLERANRELATSNSELEQFAYVASHDLQEPVRVITSFMQMLERHLGGDLDEKSRHYIERSAMAAKRMRQLIEDLLSFSRITTRTRELEPVACAVILDDALANLAVATRESGAVISSNGLDTLVVDRGQMVQLFQNLIGNAIKFRGERTPEIRIAAKKQEGEWLLSVRDNGIGIQPEHAERIFRIFQRLHTREEYPGTGIGLAICKKIVECHGGTLWMEPNRAGGTTFFFTLPLQGES